MEVPVWMCYQHIIRCSKSVYGLIKFSSHVFKQESPYPNPPPSLPPPKHHSYSGISWARCPFPEHSGVAPPPHSVNKNVMALISAPRPNELNQFHGVIKNVELVAWVSCTGLHWPLYLWPSKFIRDGGEVLAHCSLNAWSFCLFPYAHDQRCSAGDLTAAGSAEFGGKCSEVLSCFSMKSVFEPATLSFN